MHLPVGILQMPAVAHSIEERRGRAIAGEPAPERAQQLRLAREPERQRLILVEGARHQLGKANRAQQASGDARREAPARAGQHR